MVDKIQGPDLYERIQGQTEEKAREIANAEGWILRVNSRNGKSCIGTCDLRSNRLNVTINDDVVTENNGIG